MLQSRQIPWMMRYTVKIGIKRWNTEPKSRTVMPARLTCIAVPDTVVTVINASSDLITTVHGKHYTMNYDRFPHLMDPIGLMFALDVKITLISFQHVRC